VEYSKVKTIIDKWDPIDLLSFAPEDEYDFESKKIAESTSINDTVETIGLVIFSVFLESFGANTFRKSVDECVGVARQFIG
jgi:hypothetical protein